EQAAKRLEELRRAGAELPDGMNVMSDGSAALAAPTPEAVVRALESASPALAHERASRAAQHARVERSAIPGKPSTRVEIDLARLKQLGYVTPDMPKSQTADEFRVVKRPILRNALASKTRNGNL